jgi:anti-sigma regulatory factor (Ser/Thr protein kinase)
MSERIVLAPESASVPRARRFVADQLSDLAVETVDLARLLVSEVVTNAVLHARTAATLIVDRGDSTVKVQVEDSNPLLPVIRSHGPEAGTGRGLQVLDRLASDWGTNQHKGGKVVWFEIPTSLEAEEGAATGAIANSAIATEIGAPDATSSPSGLLHDPRRGVPRSSADKHENLIDFRWVGLPLALLDATAEHYDAVLREFHLVLEREPAARAAVPGRLIAVMDELTRFMPLISSVEQDLERARRAELAQLDVELDLPVEIGPLALRLDSLLDETDAYCEAGVELLSLEPSSDVVNLRKWLMGELVHQSEGDPAVPWAESPWGTSHGKRRDRIE